jgi:hypothetical protein
MSGPNHDAMTEARPWEEPGRWRRDGLPHRGRLLGILAEVAAVSAVFGMALRVPAPLGLVLGAVVWLSARRDLRLMDAGVMDQAGREATERARGAGVVSVWISLLPCLALCGLGWFVLLDCARLLPPGWR